jgi:L-ascorbate metabolism protein UlaG (beta-lactamase superfamily)
MRLTKHGHACVRIDVEAVDGGALVIDPGTYSPEVDLAGVADVLVTHEHPDHVDPELVVPAARAGTRVHAPADVVAWLASDHGVEGHAVSPGDTFDVLGLDVQVVGGEHAEIYDGLPGCANVGYVVDGVYHPGDSVFVPDVPVETLLVPTSAPWLKLREALEFVRAVKPRRAFSIHDAMLSERGEQNVDRWLDMKGGTEYARIPVGESVTLS